MHRHDEEMPRHSSRHFCFQCITGACLRARSRSHTAALRRPGSRADQDVKAGKFREDLFNRLSVVTLVVPALKERRTDIPLLAEFFLATVVEREKHGPLTLSEETIRTLVAYGWPGNVRELESAIEYAVLHARGHEIVPEDLPEKLQSAQVRAAARSPLSALFEDLPSLDELESLFCFTYWRWRGVIAPTPPRSSAWIVARFIG